MAARATHQVAAVLHSWRKPARTSNAVPVATFDSCRLVTVFGVTTLIEFKEFNPDNGGNPFPSSVARIQQLSSILHEEKPGRYRTLTCQGYFPDANRFALCFLVPFGLSPTCDSLSSLLEGKPPDLEDRFLLARELCAALFQFYTVGWVYRSFRSGNILFFSQGNLGENNISFDQPYLFGWEYSRLETEFSSRPEEEDEIEENIYRHPDQWGLPAVKFSQLHDIYSLGVVLLEIGLWKPAITFHRSRFRDCELGTYVRDYLLDSARHQRLHAAMGRRYQSLVLNCLQGYSSYSDNTEAISCRTSGKRDNISPGNCSQESTTELFKREILNVLDDIVCGL